MASERERMGLAGLEVFTDGHPRAVFFRKAPPATVTEFVPAEFREWEARWVGLDGIVGKVLGEELRRPQDVTQEYYRHFKQRNPRKLMLLHFNGKGRRPLFDAGRFSSRHWLYLAGSTVTEGAGEGAEPTTITVANPNRFRLHRPKRPGGDEPDHYPDDIVVVPPDGAGGYRWDEAQHVKLRAVDPEAGTIEVLRGFWDHSPPRPIEAESHIAPHARIRPPVVGDQTLWLYNFAPGATDDAGRTCGDVLAAELRGYLADGGVLAHFDGVQFDVMFFVPDGEAAHPPVRVFCYDEHLVDVDNDREADRGFPDGQSGRNVYGQGVTQFATALRTALPHKLLLADGMLPELHQRNLGWFNGMESEGFPVHRDPDAYEWSPALNRHAFWQSRGQAPAFNYILFKHGGNHDNVEAADPDVRAGAYRRFRLEAAAAAFTDAAVALGASLPRDDDGEPQAFDELWNGTAEAPNWLGLPLDPAVQLSTDATDLCQGDGVTWPASFVERIGGPAATVTRLPGPPPRARIRWGPDAPVHGRAGDTGAPLRRVTVPIPVGFPDGPGDTDWDLFVEVTLSGRPVPGHPAEIARRVQVQAFVDGDPVPTKPPPPPNSSAAARYYTWIDDTAFTATFLFRDAPAGQASLDIVAEGGSDLLLHRLTVHAGRGEVIREFEHGVVVANPSLHDTTIDLGLLFPRRHFRHIRGHPDQDPVNDGTPVTAPLPLPARDAVFLVEDEGGP